MSDQVTIHAISQNSNGIAAAIVTPIEISNLSSGFSIKSSGLWDTGATGSMITKSVVDKLNLSPVGQRNVVGVHSCKLVNTYAINLTLNNENVKFHIIVAECDSLGDDGSIEMLIGMDIITRGDFAVTNFGGKTTMSFRIPSIQKIDFVEGINHSKPIVSDKLPGRNQPCFCGSGIKFKYCHGKN